jgi:hypothetical protein
MSRKKESDAEIINALYEDVNYFRRLVIEKDRALNIVQKHLEAMANELQELEVNRLIEEAKCKSKE